MADAQSPSSKEAEAAAKGGKKGGRFGTVGLVVIVMVVEGAAIFGVMKFMGSDPHPAMADLHGATSMPAEEHDAEVMVVKLRALNGKSGQPVLYSIRVFVRVPASKAEQIKGMIEMKQATIEDAIARIVRGAEPTHLSEDSLETLRRQIRHELGQIVEEDSTILEVLIPECTPFPTGF